MDEPQVISAATHVRSSPHARTFSACTHLFGLSLRRQFFSRQTIVSFGLTAIALVIVLFWSMGKSPSVTRLAEEILMPVYAAFLLPIYAICYGASSIGSEREDQTLVYLLITPLPRPVIYLTKYLASTTLVLIWSMGGLVGLCLLASPSVHHASPWRWAADTVPADAPHWGLEALSLFWPAMLLGAIAYSSLFHAMGAAFRRGTIISLAYAFFLEGLLVFMPGILKRISVSFYVVSMIYGAGAEHRVKPPTGIDLFLPVSGHSATLVLGLASAGLLALGLLVFTRREYRDLS